jgi:hypothetical protein
MDAPAVTAMLERHFEYASSDPDAAHEMYHEDAVLGFPQSGERFFGLRTSASGKAITRRPRRSSFGRQEGETISGSQRFRSAMTTADLCSGSASSSFEGTRSRVSRSTSPTAGSRPSGGRSGGLPRNALNRARLASPAGSDSVGLTDEPRGGDIYHLVWWYRINCELRDFGAARGQDLGQNPTNSVLALFPGASSSSRRSSATGGAPSACRRPRASPAGSRSTAGSR